MLTYDLTQEGVALYDSLYRHIREDILSGKLKHNEKLPSKRALAENLGVSVITVENAYAQLVAEGYVAARERSGFFVEKVERHGKKQVQADGREEESGRESFRADFTANRSDENTFPFSVWAKLMRKTLLEDSEKLLKREEHAGAYELRAAVSRYLYRARGISAKPQNIVIGAGTENICSVLVQLFGRNSVFGVEDPGYDKTARIYASNDVTCRYLPLDKKGVAMKPLTESDVNILHISPTHHYPTGIVTPIGRRQELLSWAAGADNRYIIEDDYDSEFRFSGRPIPTLQSIDGEGKVVYINTFSKSLASSIRISYMILPDGLLERYTEKLGFYSCPVPSFEQYTLAKFLDGEYFERHLSRMKTLYKKRRAEIECAIERLSCKDQITVIPADSGLHFLLKVNTPLTDEQLTKRAREQNVKIACLSEYSRLHEKKYDHCLLLNYSLSRFADLSFLDKILR